MYKWRQNGLFKTIARRYSGYTKLGCTTQEFAEFSGAPILLPFNTGISSVSTQNSKEIIDCINDKKEYFTGRIPLLGIESDYNSTYII